MLPLRTILIVIIRHGLSALAGALLLNGIVDAAHLDALASVIASFVAAFAFGLGAILWSIAEKRWLSAPIRNAQVYLGLPVTGHAADLVRDVVAKSGGQQP